MSGEKLINGATEREVAAGKRIEWLGVAKGIGILLVVLGHCMNINGRPFRLIFVFHMPLFFFLSGYVFHPGGIRRTIVHKARTLLIPYVVFALIGLAFTLLLPFWRSALTWDGIRWDLWFADPEHIHNSSIWFLVCLYFVCVIFALLCHLSFPVMTFGAMVLYAAGIWYARHCGEFTVFGYHRLPLNLDVVPAALAFYYFGYAFKQYHLLEKPLDARSNQWAAAVFGLLAVGLCYLFNGYVNIHGLNFGNAVYYLIGGLSGTVMVVGASRIAAESPHLKPLKKILMFYGRNSLIILGIQSLLIRLYIQFNNRVRGTEMTMYQMPRLHTLVSFVLIAFIICPAVCGIWEKARTLKGKVNRHGRK